MIRPAQTGTGGVSHVAEGVSAGPSDESINMAVNHWLRVYAVAWLLCSIAGNQPVRLYVTGALCT